jgi:hypothetical protein
MNQGYRLCKIAGDAASLRDGLGWDGHGFEAWVLLRVGRAHGNLAVRLVDYVWDRRESGKFPKYNIHL